MSPTATASSGPGLLIHGGPTPAALAASTSTATPTPTPASLRTGAAVRTVLSIPGVRIPTSQEILPAPAGHPHPPTVVGCATAPGAPVYRLGMTVRPRGEPQNTTTSRRALLVTRLACRRPTTTSGLDNQPLLDGSREPGRPVNCGRPSPEVSAVSRQRAKQGQLGVGGPRYSCH